MENISIKSIEDYKEAEATVLPKVKVSLNLGKDSTVSTADVNDDDENTISMSSTDTQTISGRQPTFVKELPQELYVKVTISYIVKKYSLPVTGR